MKLKNLIIIVSVLICSLQFSYSQVPENYSFFKLYVKNDKNETMLVEWDKEWEIPGRKYKGSNTVNEFVKLMAENHGIVVKNVKLRALVTFHYDTKPNPTLMQYYTADFVSGNLKAPLGVSNVKWFTKKDVYTSIPYSEMVEIMQYIDKDTSTLWTGAYKITKKTNSSKRTSSIKEKLSPL